MTLAKLRERWTARRDEWRRFADAHGAAIADEILTDLADLEREAAAELVSLREAAMIGGYSVDHLQRMVATGVIANVGRKGKPRIRRDDVPLKPGHRSLRDGEDSGHLASSRRDVVSQVTRSGT